MGTVLPLLPGWEHRYARGILTQRQPRGGKSSSRHSCSWLPLQHLWRHLRQAQLVAQAESFLLRAIHRSAGAASTYLVVSLGSGNRRTRLWHRWSDYIQQTRFSNSVGQDETNLQRKQLDVWTIFPHSAVCIINFCKVACSRDCQCRAFEYLYNIRRPAT